MAHSSSTFKVAKKLEGESKHTLSVGKRRGYLEKRSREK